MEGLDWTHIALSIAAVLLVGGGIWSTIVRRKIAQTIVLLAACIKLLNEFTDATADGTITPEERQKIIEAVQAVYKSVCELFSQRTLQKASDAVKMIV